MNHKFLFLILFLQSFSFLNCCKKEKIDPLPACKEPVEEILKESVSKPSFSSEFFIRAYYPKKILKLKVFKPDESQYECHVSLDDKIIHKYDCMYSGVNTSRILPMGTDDQDDLNLPDLFLFETSGQEGCAPGAPVFLAVYPTGKYFVEDIPVCAVPDEIQVDQKRITVHFPEHFQGASTQVSSKTYIFDFKTKKLEVR